MTFYIATNVHGQGVKHITQFETRRGMYLYVWEALSCTDRKVSKSMTIDELCEALGDYGPGTGARSHYRIPAGEAKASGIRINWVSHYG